MAYAAYSSMRHQLISDTPLTSLVSTSNIRVGFGNITGNYPMITISQIGGSTHGLTGYKTSPAGSKTRRDDRMFQVDIYSRDSVESLELIASAVDVALMSGNGYRRTNDNGIYEEGIKAHRKIQTWTFWDMIND